jgi:hypothetical protein
MKIDRNDHVRCWAFFHCSVDVHSVCLMKDAEEWRCWLVNIVCCKMDKDTPRPVSTKAVICKNCAYYKTYKDLV